ncbi:hypothetical protein TI39_contig314g00001 [Zymoseptoria brevis]|uniref:Uncharacterized protein n=1 Tax=Zymoseptoria brevis TaxID=1047168 RepID=A0A0F4GX01_9PEZI|nr:hypothetical protein TI39_contig314g00001 [Zymoseptoria brevis]
MADEYYETMDDILLSVTIDDKSIYNPAMSFVYEPDATVPVQGDVDDEDVFTSATFDNPDAPGEDQDTSSAMDLDDPAEGPVSAPGGRSPPSDEDTGEQNKLDPARILRTPSPVSIRSLSTARHRTTSV